MKSADVESSFSVNWTWRLDIRSHGLSIRLKANRMSMGRSLLELLPPAWKSRPSHRPDRVYGLEVTPQGHGVAWVNGRPRRRFTSRHWMRSWFKTQLELFVAEYATRHVFVHSGAVVWRGRAILIPGESRAGKTSLVQALLAEGTSYLSDEFAVLDRRGRAVPYPRSLGVREAGSGRTRPVEPEAIGARRARGTYPVGLVVLTAYRPRDPRDLRELTVGEAILRSMRFCAAGRRKPEVVMASLRAAFSNALLLGGPRGEASDMASALLFRLERHEAGMEAP